VAAALGDRMLTEPVEIRSGPVQDDRNVASRSRPQDGGTMTVVRGDAPRTPKAGRARCPDRHPSSDVLDTLASVARATFHQAADCLPARDAPSWTEERLMGLEAYLAAFAKACSKAGGWYGLDLFAGTGLNWSTTRDAPTNGSALIALEVGAPAATKVLVAEAHTKSNERSNHDRSRGSRQRTSRRRSFMPRRWSSTASRRLSPRLP
jgi:hypothetical protein